LTLRDDSCFPEALKIEIMKGYGKRRGREGYRKRKGEREWGGWKG